MPSIGTSDNPTGRGLVNTADQYFHTYEDVQKWVDSWLASKDVLFF